MWHNRIEAIIMSSINYGIMKADKWTVFHSKTLMINKYWKILEAEYTQL